MKLSMIIYPVFVLSIFLSSSGWSQSIVGKWQTIDDNTGKTRSIVEVFEQNGKYFGKIIKLVVEPGEDPNPRCTACTGKLNGQRVVGMQIINNMVKSGNEYIDGDILDPENGKSYKCKLWVEEGKLKVRGYIMFLYRTQTWLPFNDTNP